MLPKRLLSTRHLIFLVFFGTTLLYVFIRANTLSFTHDESLSYTIVQGAETWSATANNHLLNTQLMSLSQSLFGSSELALRLPNVLAFLFYLLGCYLMLRKARHFWLLLFGLSLLLLNPFLLEFFSVARGYGLSLGFLMISLCFLLREQDHSGNPQGFLFDFGLCSCFAALAFLASLSLINVYIALLLLFVYKYVKYCKKEQLLPSFHLSFWSIVLLSGLPLYFGIQRLFLLEARDQLYFGASRFLQGLDTLIGSSISFQQAAPGLSLAIRQILFTALLVGLIHTILKKKFQGPLFQLSLLIALLVLGLYLEHYLFEANFPNERTALYYLPILGLYLFHLLKALLQDYSPRRKYDAPVIGFLVLAFLINFVAGLNFSRCKTWDYDAHTKEAMHIIKEITDDTDYSWTISNHWLLEPGINYYIQTLDIKLEPANRNGVQLHSDFIYRLDDTTKLDNYLLLQSFGSGKTELLVKKK